MGKIDDNDEEKYCLTPWGVLCSVLLDYNINVDHITGKMGEHLVEDFMDAMVTSGYVAKKSDGEVDE